MNTPVTSIRPFIGAKDYAVSRAFYLAWGFEEVELGPTMSLFKLDEKTAFYLQRAYVKDWVDNTMLFLEVTDLDQYYTELWKLDLPGQFAGVRLSGIKEQAWGSEFFLHDPAGILWHIGEFSK